MSRERTILTGNLLAVCSPRYSGVKSKGSPALVLQEVLYRYTSLEQPDLAREVYDAFVQICPVVLDVTLAETELARNLLGEVGGISARDAIHAAVMINHDLEWIASFDMGFDCVPAIRRLELK